MKCPKCGEKKGLSLRINWSTGKGQWVCECGWKGKQH
jgi:hypothetical protein